MTVSRRDFLRISAGGAVAVGTGALPVADVLPFAGDGTAQNTGLNGGACSYTFIGVDALMGFFTHILADGFGNGGNTGGAPHP